MQISHVEVIPTELRLKLPYRSLYHRETKVQQIDVVFIRVETREGQTAWGCAAFDPTLTGETREEVLRACQACADRARDLNPLNTEYALAVLARLTEGVPSAQCAFDIAFHDLLGLAAGLPLHRLLGGYRDRIQTSVTINVGTVEETVEMAHNRARQGFRILKLKGGRDPEEDVRRVRAVHKALPNLTVRLDAEQGYTIREAIEVTKALADHLEMLEQPVPADDGVKALKRVTRNSPVPILADESARGPDSALALARERAVDGLSIKLATCGGLRGARQMDAVARAARMTTMVGCINEPALLTAAGLAFALSSPGVTYGDLDGYFDLADDPTRQRFILDEGWLIATDVPGLGCTVEL
ncbi:MAG: mandelate racemase/muconate lactonizing enzyme family protein [Anaerolineae bacterium]